MFIMNAQIKSPWTMPEEKNLVLFSKWLKQMTDFFLQNATMVDVHSTKPHVSFSLGFYSKGTPSVPCVTFT